MSRFGKLMDEYGLPRHNNFAYGVMEGYMVSFTETAAAVNISVGVYFPAEEVREEFLQALTQQLRAQTGANAWLREAGIFISVPASRQALKRVQVLVEWILPELHKLDAQGLDTCPLCGQPVNDAKVDAQIKGVVCLAHRGCVEDLLGNAQQEEQQTRRTNKHVLRGAVGAFVGGLIGTIPWIVAYYAGWFVGLFGLLIGLAANGGYKIAGGKPCKAKLLVVAAAVTFNVLAAFVLSVGISYAVNIISGTMHYTLPTVIPLTILYVSDPDFWLDMMPDIILGLVFAFAGSGSVLKELKEESKSPAKAIRILDES